MNSCTHVFVHFVWATWNREPLIDSQWQSALQACLAETCHARGGQALEIGGVTDHVHLLARVPATVAVAQMAHDLKGASSHLIRHCIAPETDFRWQGAYGAFSVSPEDVPAVRAYIQNQPAHHAGNTLHENWERCTE